MMSNYWIQVFLLRVVCRDTESVNSSDKFGLSGAISTDLESVGFVKPMFRINDGETHSFMNTDPIFSGGSSLPRVGIVLRGWDIDENDSWVENEEDIIQAAKLISTAVKQVPGYGTFAGAVLDGMIAVLPPIIDQFIEWDHNDELLNYDRWIDLPTEGAYVSTQLQQSIRFYRADPPLDYSGWDYSIDLAIQCLPTPSFGQSDPNLRSAAQMAMRAFRQRADLAAREGLPGAFPNFYEATRNQDHVAGTVFLFKEVGNPPISSGGSPPPPSGVTTGVRMYNELSLSGISAALVTSGISQPVVGLSLSGISELQDVPLSELGNPALDDFMGRFRGTQDYAYRNGFVGGFPNFYHADYGNGVVCGTVLIRSSAGEWRDVPLSELGNPALDDFTARFKATQDYANRNGFVGGFPNFYHADHGNGIVCGTILIKRGGGEWRDVVLYRDP